MKIDTENTEPNEINLNNATSIHHHNRGKIKLNKLANSYVINKIKLLFLILLFYLCLNIFHFGCPIKYFTGISCAGCGMTRAVHSALLFQFSEAFHYHPLFPLVPIMVLLFLFEDRVKANWLKFAWITIIVIFLVTYFVRLFILKSDIISIDFNSSVMLKLLHIRV